MTVTMENQSRHGGWRDGYLWIAFFHEFSLCDLVSRNCPQGHAQKPPRDVPSRGISAKLPVATGTNEAIRAIVVLLRWSSLNFLQKTRDPYNGALLSSQIGSGSPK